VPVETPKVFVSYSHDGEAHEQRVLGLSEKLRGGGVQTDLDLYVQGTPEQGWPRWMLDRLDEADRVLVVCTQMYYRRFRGHEQQGVGKGADWEGTLITQELYDARNQTVKFVPVLFHLTDKKFIPEPLRKNTFYVLETEAEYDRLYAFLLGGAGVEPRPLGLLRRPERGRGQALALDGQRDPARPPALHGVPELPPHFLARGSPLATLKSAVLSREPQRVGISTPSRTGLHGLGGIGKTVLGAALARDPDVQAAFPDGIYWLTLGQQPDLLALQRALLEWATGESDRLESVNLGTVAIQRTFADMRSLVVLDDVWQRAHVEPFAALGALARLIVTTRDRAILTALGANTVEVDVLDPAGALSLVAEWAGHATAELPPEASEVVRECGCLPLALALAGAQVRDGASWEDIARALREGKITFLDQDDGGGVFAALDASVRTLSQPDAVRYRQLAFVPEDTSVPESVVVRLWEYDGLDALYARKLLRTFANKALLFVDGDAANRFLRFHDLQVDYLRLVAADPHAPHQRLLDAHFEMLPGSILGPIRWASLPPVSAYLWQHLLYHLLEAGRLDTVQSLTTDVRWLMAKAAATGAASLLSNLAALVKRAPTTRNQRIEGALRLEAGWLHRDAEALPGLLYNRLRSDGLTEEEIACLANGLRPAVRLRHPVTFGGGRAFRGHSGEVTACVYSPDGTRVLSASADQTVREWDAATGRELRRFEGHTLSASACAYSPDGTRVLSASWDQTVREWDAATGRELRRFERHTGRVSACAYSPDGTRVLSASWDQTVREWDAATGFELQRFEGHTGPVRACAYSPDGTRVLSASGDRTVREWDQATGRELRRFEGHTRGVSACAYSPIGARALSASSDMTVREWDQATGRELRRFEGHNRPVMACAYSPDGTRMLSASWDMTVREWDQATGRELRRLEGHTHAVPACAYSPDGTRVLSASADRTVREWDAATGRELRRFEGHRRPVMACAYSPDGTRVLSASADRTVREWDAATGRELRRFEGHTSVVPACAYSPDGTRVLTASADRTVREWDAATGRELRRFEGHKRPVRACAYSPDGTRVLSASDNGKLREWDAATGRQLRRFGGHSGRVTACAYSPDGTRVLSASWDETFREWDAATGRELRRFGHSGEVTACGYSPDGTRVLSASGDRKLREWDAATGCELRRFEGHSGAVTACVYSPDGARVLSASDDCTIKVWSRRDEQCLLTVYGAATFHCLAAAPRQLAAGDGQGNVWLLDCNDM
jgi:WD40 repeat protein